LDSRLTLSGVGESVDDDPFGVILVFVVVVVVGWECGGGVGVGGGVAGCCG